MSCNLNQTVSRLKSPLWSPAVQFYLFLYILSNLMNNKTLYLIPHLFPIRVGLVWIIWWLLWVILQYLFVVESWMISSYLIFWHVTSLSKNNLSTWILVFVKIETTTSLSNCLSSLFQKLSVSDNWSIWFNLWTEQNWEKL